MKVGETITLTENDMFMVRVTNGDDYAIYFGPCDMSKAMEIAVAQLVNYKTVKLEQLTEPWVGLT